MEATEPLFFFARSAVEPPNVVLAFTVKPSFTFQDKICHIVFDFFWLYWFNLIKSGTNNKRWLDRSHGNKSYLELASIFSLVLPRFTLQWVPPEKSNSKQNIYIIISKTSHQLLIWTIIGLSVLYFSACHLKEAIQNCILHSGQIYHLQNFSSIVELLAILISCSDLLLLK